MFPQVFTAADTLPYRLWEGESPSILDSNEYLITPPRVYQEEVFFLQALAVVERPNPWSRYSLLVFSAQNQVRGPGWNFTAWWFDAYTGRYVDRGDFSNLGGALTDTMNQAADGLIWHYDAWYRVRALDPLTLAPIPGLEIPHDRFGGSPLNQQKPCFVFDRQRNRAVVQTAAEGNDQIGVYDFTTGALIRRIGVAGHVHAIAAEDATRVFVVSRTGIVTLVDYESGAILGVSQLPIAPDIFDFLVTWDRNLRRLLTVVHTPDAVDGDCTTRIRGYAPRPQAVGITPPLPLAVARPGRPAPVLVHAYGGAGEPIGGLHVAFDAAVPGRLLSRTAQTSASGDAIVQLDADAAGLSTVSASATP